MKTKTITLEEDERIIAVVPERCVGPGWSNRPVWVHISDACSKLRTECLQPEEQTSEMLALFGIAVETQRSLMSAVPKNFKKQRKAA